MMMREPALNSTLTVISAALRRDIGICHRCLTAPQKSLQLVMEKGNQP